MKQARRLLVPAAALVVFGVAVTAPKAFGPGSKISGGDLRLDHAETAWFLGADQTIRYCVERADKFAPSKAMVEATIGTAFGKWRRYIETRVNPGTTTKLATKAKLLPSCDGSENLSFFFGVTPPAAEDVMPHFNNPAAFAVETAYDAASGWGKGFVWVSGTKDYRFDDDRVAIIDWTKPKTLEAILLHELGHVFGSAHAAGTIMDAGIAQRIANAYYPGEEHDTGLGFLGIDDTSELVTCDQCAEVLDGVLGPDLKPEIVAVTFANLVGREPQGAVSAQLAIDYVRKEVAYPADPRFVLTVKDERESFQFPVQLAQHRYWTDTPGPAALSWLEKPRPGGAPSLASRGVRIQTVPGAIKTRDGETIEVFFERNYTNWGASPVALTWVREDLDARIPLFRSWSSSVYVMAVDAAALAGSTASP